MGACASAVDDLNKFTNNVTTSLNTPQNQTTSSIVVPGIPGWDGVDCPVLTKLVELPYTNVGGSFQCDIKPMLDCATAMDTAGCGYRLAAYFLPIMRGYAVLRAKYFQVKKTCVISLSFCVV